MKKLLQMCKSKSLLSLLVVTMMLFTMSTSFIFADETAAEPNGNTSTTEAVTESEAQNQIVNTVDIITFNDFHGNLAEDVRETGKNIGMAKIVGYVKDALKKNPNTIVVSGGDNYQGSALSNLTYGAPVSEMMKAMGVVASAVGNHEFDWGIQHMEKWAKDGGFNFLAANIYDANTGKPVDWAKPYLIVEKADIKIAFVGLAHPDTVTLTKAENVTGLEFKDPVKAAQTWVDYLKNGKAKEGTPDVIIALTHIDSKQDRETKEITGLAAELANKVEGLDAIVSAHSHQTVAGKVNEVPIVQAYKHGRALGKISIELNDDKTVKDITASVDNVYKNKNNLIADEEASKVYEKYTEDLNPILKEVIGTAKEEFTHNRNESNVSLLGKWVCDMKRKRTGCQVAIQNGGGLRRSLYSGDITMGDLYEIMPFDNTLVTMELSGKDLKKAIDHGILNPNITDGQFSGLKVEYDKNKEFENRITSIALEDGTPLEMDKYYTVVINDFMLTGGDGYDFSNAKNVVNTYIPIRDMLVEAIKETKTITPEPVDYIIEVSKPVAEEQQLAEPKQQQDTIKTYTVQINDMLWKIAKKFGTTYQKITEFNKLKNPNLIYPGQKLLIPAN
ncbi:5'-nucleotidase C-terminal domain-containing protein [Paramaledivibacter caminithermalis]|uniref:2',3'-cyclic-nucleotide 2'-phosphodiesterase / 3'-nucleotidase n=1 Tax=Paramaledivibacter caminithermalis (strain DSM 15212 / CIP 107654 / DViRD3) TaxID=1121301 RepID=A0A1M6PMT9_PARC5|nr:5'-nucleotidase C-terminal domain-containing protein [Paramaledivibacter caminithermalis]SHK09279.1 2',3'-cyclic-nucleotide 2'-phosphodiesterase / 3'-nucleotidase [Paramaledivibacter caminithermalis DSM 15212]